MFLRERALLPNPETHQDEEGVAQSADIVREAIFHHHPLVTQTTVMTDLDRPYC